MQKEKKPAAASALLRFLVADMLPKGKENAVSTAYLYKALGFTDARSLQTEIAREREAGAVILSTCQDGGGYYLPGSAAEVKEFIETLESRAKNTFLALRSARRWLRQQEG
ncbi:MAG: hypothetical protein Q4E24_03785 [bacterium]|nr:hypothetical protein [bacterium]